MITELYTQQAMINEEEDVLPIRCRQNKMLLNDVVQRVKPIIKWLYEQVIIDQCSVITISSIMEDCALDLLPSPICFC